jgi:hypothetical protein
MKKLLSLISLGLWAVGGNAQNPATFTFPYTGSFSSLPVPCGVDSVYIQAWGAQGGNGNAGGNNSAGGNGGNGGYVEGWLHVTPGDLLFVFVGGQGTAPNGGFNGGGTGGSQSAGGGGGASDVRLNGNTVADRVVVAGGGGGGGRGGCELASVTGGNGGGGGNSAAANGTNGNDAPTPNQNPTGVAGGGFGATSANGGAAGIGCSGFLGAPGITATSETGGNGGNGQTCCCFNAQSVPGGGGGGDGYLGGGGGGGGSAGTTGCSGNDKGAGGGGAGGSSYAVAGMTGIVYNDNSRTGDGEVWITYIVPVPPPPALGGPARFCLDAIVTFNASTSPVTTSHVWTVPSQLVIISGQGSNAISVGATAPGTYYINCYQVNDSCLLNSFPDSILVVVDPLPVVSAGPDLDTICAFDAPVTLVNGSPFGGIWSGSGVSGNSFSPNSLIPNQLYPLVYTYTDTNGCSNFDTSFIYVDICGNVNELSISSLSFFPNPATDILQVNWSSHEAQIRTIELHDATGRLVLTHHTGNDSGAQLQVSQLPAGAYTLTVSDVQKRRATYSFVKK